MREAISTNSGGPPETSLVWLRHDLRLEDNPVFALPSVRRPYQLLVMYVLDQRWLTPVEGLPRLGPARLRLLWQSLTNLRGMLLRRGSDLLVRVGGIPSARCWPRSASMTWTAWKSAISRTPDDVGNLQPSSPRNSCEVPGCIATHVKGSCWSRSDSGMRRRSLRGPVDASAGDGKPGPWCEGDVSSPPRNCPSPSRLSPALASCGAMSLRLD